MADPDGALLQRAYTGDEGAFIDLYERHRRPLFRFVYRMLGSVPVAEDVTHECFLVLLTHRDRFDPERASLRTFLCAIGRNLSLKQLRKRGLETLVDELPEGVDREPGLAAAPLAELIAGERSTAVQEAVASLPPLQREVIILFEYEGQSLAEVAQIVEADLGTVKARLHRARERLRRTLAPWMSQTTAAVPLRRVEKMA
jgi:RNA polymerase sigma-70 factor (ECF subfamily)